MEDLIFDDTPVAVETAAPVETKAPAVETKAPAVETQEPVVEQHQEQQETEREAVRQKKSARERIGDRAKAIVALGIETIDEFVEARVEIEFAHTPSRTVPP